MVFQIGYQTDTQGGKTNIARAVCRVYLHYGAAGETQKIANFHWYRIWYCRGISTGERKGVSTGLIFTTLIVDDQVVGADYIDRKLKIGIFIER